MDDMDMDIEEAEEGDEKPNRTFIILVAVMGGLLLVGILAFCVWAFAFGPDLLNRRTVASDQTPAAIAEAAQTATAAAVLTAVVETPAPTEAPPTPPEATATEELTRAPTASPTPKPETAEPTGENPGETGTTATVTGAGATPANHSSPTATVSATTRSKTPGGNNNGTPSPTEPVEGDIQQTGFGVFTGIILAGGLLVLLFVARRLRTARAER
jgi:cytoskeletal protein RodZ